MPKDKRSHSEKAEEERQPRGPSRGKENEVMKASGAKVALAGTTVGERLGYLTDPRIDHPANAPLKARIATDLQQQYGNAYVRRAIAEGQQERGGTHWSDVVGKSTYPAGRDSAPERALGTGFRVTQLGDGARLSVTLGARLDNGEGGAAPATPEEEREKVQALEPIEVPANILVGGEDQITGRMGLHHATQQGGADMAGAFGICQPILSSILVGATPQEHLLGLLGTTYDVRVSVDIDYHWDVQPLGHTHVGGAADPAVTADTWSQVVHDLTPSSAVPCRSPRVEHWCRDLTTRHELFHRDDFVTAFTVFAPVSQIWLNAQSASSVEGAIDKGEEAVGMLVTNVNNYMGSGDSAPAEVRAYEDGRAPYQSRADAVREKATREGWEEGLVILG